MSCIFGRLVLLRSARDDGPDVRIEGARTSTSTALAAPAFHFYRNTFGSRLDWRSGIRGGNVGEVFPACFAEAGNEGFADLCIHPDKHRKKKRSRFSPGS